MSERKVLNKYYPPDFDPSKIPKNKGPPRNATFVIRLMAPCNMRCTTCGEYIYKGRKFNARKEDVDDMSYLGLRIYRFYIKCTACVSEICFRTDPENTDYVLESGATRNFEALKKAEEQRDREEKAKALELENNPMKLLEMRTEASKNEMELAESLDELRELNRRTVSIDYNSMIKNYEDIREQERAATEAADEEFVRGIFSKSGDVKVKRLLETGSSSGSSDDDVANKNKKKSEKPTNNQEKKKSDKPSDQKKLKTDNPTDHLTGPVAKVEKKEVWQKSIGTLSTGKSGLSGLVKKKTTSQDPKSTNTAFKKPAIVVAPKNAQTPKVVAKAGPSHVVQTKENGGGGLGGLGLLGAYSDSESGSD